MKSHSRLLINAGFLMVAMLHAVAADVKVIANPNVKADSHFHCRTPERVPAPEENAERWV